MRSCIVLQAISQPIAPPTRHPCGKLFLLNSSNQTAKCFEHTGSTVFFMRP
jgi:hypothetical protein